MGSYDIDKLGDSEMKTSYSEDSLMTSSSTDCGNHVERGRSSSDLKKSILRGRVVAWVWIFFAFDSIHISSVSITEQNMTFQDQKGT
jgi:hypothetical protein